MRGEIHFLKIDVQGSESDVLRGCDFVRYRPWIVVIEATEPLSAIASLCRIGAHLGRRRV